MDKIYYAKAYDRNKNIQYFLSNKQTGILKMKIKSK